MRIIHTALAASLLALPAVATAQKGAALDDAAIVGIFDAANTWDISTGSLANRQGARADVKEFGAMLARDHKAVQQQGRDLAKKLGVTPTPVAADFALKKDYDATMKQLKTLHGAAFDKAFLEHEVAYHKAVIDAVTHAFLPAIKNGELKAFVEKVAPAFAAHEAAAENLLKK
ncbi:MAG: DUF4142 domain-containing protein [Gemmatimonadetes bacterium]|nr:DUF4142 domain-containing protein [Gemmatimonadota bacterium]